MSTRLQESYPRINPETGRSGPTPKEHCTNGHLISEVGRVQSGGCSACSRESIAKRRRKRDRARRDRVNAYKVAIGCERCGYDRCAHALHFHHKGEKVFNVASKVKALSWENLLPEIEKCNVLCANCHAEATWGS